MNARAGARRSAVSMPTNLTLLPIARASLARAGVSFLHGWQLEAQKFITIGLPASLANSIVPGPRRFGSLMLGAGTCSRTKPICVLVVRPRLGAVTQCSASRDPADSTAAATNTRPTATARLRRDQKIPPEFDAMPVTLFARRRRLRRGFAR